MDSECANKYKKSVKESLYMHEIKKTLVLREKNIQIGKYQLQNKEKIGSKKHNLSYYYC